MGQNLERRYPNTGRGLPIIRSGVMDHGIPSTGGNAEVTMDPDGGDPDRRPVRPPSMVDAVVPLIALAGLIAGSLALFGLDALDGPIQVALILTTPRRRSSAA